MGARCILTTRKKTRNMREGYNNRSGIVVLTARGDLRVAVSVEQLWNSDSKARKAWAEVAEHL